LAASAHEPTDRDQHRRFADDGYAVLQGLLAPALVGELAGEVDAGVPADLALDRARCRLRTGDLRTPAAQGTR